jgi:hypothetical protein
MRIREGWRKENQGRERRKREIGLTEVGKGNRGDGGRKRETGLTETCKGNRGGAYEGKEKQEI